MKPRRKKLQVVFQDPFRLLNPRWTIARSLTEGPVNYGVPMPRPSPRPSAR